ncbi:MAG TPA: geranylgeranyl reductase family protein [Acidisarcina sp.]
MWDAIVVGAGPAGCAAAYDLAVAGRSVSMVDRCDFPRPKACAGGLTMKAVRALRYSVDPVVREVVHRIVLEKNGVSPTLVKTRKPICVMTVRSEFDAFCFRKTLAAGVTFLKVRGVKEVRSPAKGDWVEVDTGDEVLRGSFVVGADGVNSQVRRFCAGAVEVKGGFALEAQVPLQAAKVDLTFDFGAVKNGYGWVFPKGDHLNVGLGYYGGPADEKLNRERLVSYVRGRLGTDAVDHVVGQYLGVSAVDSACAYGRVLLAGDAAGLVDPLTAEGIYSAVVSGQAASKAIDTALSVRDQRDGDAGVSREAVQKCDSSYEETLKPLREMLAFSARAAEVFYENPDRGFKALTFPGLRTALLRTYAEGMGSGMLLRILRSRRNG